MPRAVKHVPRTSNRNQAGVEQAQTLALALASQQQRGSSNQAGENHTEIFAGEWTLGKNGRTRSLVSSPQSVKEIL
jgi:hypothetical protein